MPCFDSAMFYTVKWNDFFSLTLDLSSFDPTEQIFQNIRQEYSRYQRRRQLEGAFNQTEPCSSTDIQSSSPALTSPSSPTGQSTQALKKQKRNQNSASAGSIWHHINPLTKN